ncbi:MAG TPA: hypothetical protein VFU31_10955 [Candidatus Binatia bacterium]|nr:hypothetical protein [Candidatus Binatia bacterium]
MAKKKSHDEEIQRGLEELGRAGMRLDDVSPGLVARLKEQWGRTRDIDLAVIFALGKIPDEASVQALGEIQNAAKDKEIKKAVRRSLFKLAQRGLVLPEESSPGAKTPSPFMAPAANIEAQISAVDGAGGRLIWIVKPQPGAGLQVIQAMVSDREGLQRIGGAPMPRKELRRMGQQIKEQHGVTMIAVPWEFADQTLYEGFERAKAGGRSGLEHFHQLRSTIVTGKPSPQAHPIYQRLSADDTRAGPWREQSRHLLEEPELRFWLVDTDWLQPFLPQLEEAQTSRLVLNPVQKEERLAGIVRDAVKALCAGEPGNVMRRRMEDMALYFTETGRQEQAKLALAVALQIGEGDPGPLDISFLTGLVQKSLAFHLSEQKKKSEAEPSLIVKP